jgi:hypothetical protein
VVTVDDQSNDTTLTPVTNGYSKEFWEKLNV